MDLHHERPCMQTCSTDQIDYLEAGQEVYTNIYISVWKACIQSFDFTFSEDSDWYTVKKPVEHLAVHRSNPLSLRTSALSNFFPVLNSSDERKQGTHDGKHSTDKGKHKYSRTQYTGKDKHSTHEGKYRTGNIVI